MMVVFLLAAELGFEPRHTESESAVLPLHNSAISYCRSQRVLVYHKEFALSSPFWKNVAKKNVFFDGFHFLPQSLLYLLPVDYIREVAGKGEYIEKYPRQALTSA